MKTVPSTLTDSQTSSEYTIQSVVRACQVLKCCEQTGAGVSLDQVARRTGLTRPTVFRLLVTLVECGLLERPMKNTYRLSTQSWHQKRYRIGYASQSEEFSFSRLVSDSIRSSAFEAGIDLIVLSNCYSPKVAIRNAEHFIRERVDLVIEFQTDQQSAAIIGSKLMDAGIPVIAIDVPHPGAIYYGADNFRAGLIAGRALAHACIKDWQGEVDEIVLLKLPMAGPLPNSRLTGTVAGIREILPKISDQKIRFLDGNGRFETSLEVVRRYVSRRRSSRVLLTALNDPSCLGALQAFEEAGLTDRCLAIGQNGSIEARREMRRPSSRLVGSVAYFPERYGESIISLALDRVQGKELPTATFVKHQLLTALNVDSIYPNDALLTNSEGEDFLLSKR